MYRYIHVILGFESMFSSYDKAYYDGGEMFANVEIEYPHRREYDFMFGMHISIL